MVGLTQAFARVQYMVQSISHDLNPPDKSHLTDNPISRQYEARTNALELLKKGDVAAFNAAQDAARAADPEHRLKLSIEDGLPSSREAWGMLIELVHGKHAVTAENLSCADNQGSWFHLLGEARHKNITVPDYLTAAIYRRDEPPEPVNLSFSSIGGADLQNADLRLADLSWTRAREANFSGADLRGVNFHFADLRDADFKNAEVEGVDFTGADLSGAKGLTPEMLAGCKIDEQTVLPQEYGKSRLRRRSMSTPTVEEPALAL